MTADASAWTLICESSPTRQFQMPMAEWGDTLYVLTPDELLASTDEGETWNSIGTRPKGDVFELLITDEAFYLVFEKHIFRSDDAGKTWMPVMQELHAHITRINDSPALLISDAVALDSEISRLKRADMPRIIEERLTNGGFTITTNTVFMEYRRKLFRWHRSEKQWFNTGLTDSTKRADDADISKGFTLAASGNVVYVGKRDGSLFQSLNNGDSWKEVTVNLPFSFAYFRDIVFAGTTVYLITNQGVMNSHDGVNWNVLTDTEENRIPISRIAVDGSRVYGMCNQGVYRINSKTDTWIQISPEVPDEATALAVDGDILYIGTRHSGVLRLQLNEL